MKQKKAPSFSKESAFAAIDSASEPLADQAVDLFEGAAGQGAAANGRHLSAGLFHQPFFGIFNNFRHRFPSVHKAYIILFFSCSVNKNGAAGAAPL